MTTAALLPVWRFQATSNGAPVPGAKLYTYLSGTTTPQATYTTAALTIAHANPVEADMTGLFPAIYLSPVTYRVLLTDADGVTIIPPQDGVSDIGQLLTLLPQWPAPTNRCGVVTVYPPQTKNGVAVPVAPDGSLIPTTGTATSGLQEAIDYACAHGYDLDVLGGDESTGGAVAYRCLETIEWPSMQGKKIRFGAITIGGGSSADPVMRFDSMMMCDIQMAGTQISAARTGDMLVFEPRTQVPVDPVASIIDTRFFLTTVAGPQANASTAAVRFKATAAGTGIAASSFEFSEINGCDFQILIDTPSSTSDVLNNRIICPHVHTAFGSNPHIQVGNAVSADNARIRDTYWDVHIATNAGAGTKRGFDTRATRDRGFVFVSGATAQSIFFEAEADRGLLTLASDDNSVATLVQDGSTARTNRVLVQQTTEQTVVTVGATPYVYPASALFYARDEMVLITGGAVTTVELGNGSTWTDTGMIAGAFFKPAGMFLRITYAVTPTITSWVT